jgi:hypothetical protein
MRNELVVLSKIDAQKLKMSWLACTCVECEWFLPGWAPWRKTRRKYAELAEWRLGTLSVPAVQQKGWLTGSGTATSQ